MKNIEVRMPILNQAFKTLLKERESLQHAAVSPKGVMNSGLSSIAGISSAGAIHGMLAVDGPGSAAHALAKFSDKIFRIGNALREWGELNQREDSALATQLDADMEGLMDGGDTVVFDPGQEVDIPPVSFVPPMVSLERDLPAVVKEIAEIDSAQITSTTNFWQAVAQASQRASHTLSSVMESVAANNSGDFIDKAVASAHKLAQSLDQLSENATLMAGRTETFGAKVSDLKQSAQLLNVVIAHVPIKRLQHGARGQVVKALASGLQSAVDMSLPAPGSLSDPLRDLNIPEVITPNQPTMPDYKAGLDVGEATLPQSIAPEVEGNTQGADGFEMVDGHLRPKGAAGLSEQDLHRIDQVVDNHIRGLSDQVGEDITVGDIHTQGAGQMLSPGMAGGGTSSLLQGSVVPPALAGGGTGGGIGSPGNASLNRFIGGAGTGGIGSAGGTGFAGGNGSAGGMGRVLPPASATPALGGHAGVGSMGQSVGGSMGQQGAGGMARTSGMGGGMAPMAGARGNGGGSNKKEDEKENPAMNTSEYEQEQNLRALLDPLPPAIPGVIGAWARED